MLGQFLNEAGWSKLETQAVFAIELAMFALVMVFAGRLLASLGPRTLALMGGVSLGVGYVLAGLLGATSFWVVAVCVGLIGGAGIGFAYVVPIADLSFSRVRPIDPRNDPPAQDQTALKTWRFRMSRVWSCNEWDPLEVSKFRFKTGRFARLHGCKNSLLSVI